MYFKSERIHYIYAAVFLAPSSFPLVPLLRLISPARSGDSNHLVVNLDDATGSLHILVGERRKSGALKTLGNCEKYIEDDSGAIARSIGE